MLSQTLYTPQVAARMLARVLGGKGSGNFGHAGRPGLVGGSGGSYHGTSEEIGAKIKAEGLKAPMNGAAFVSLDADAALTYALEKGGLRVALITISKSAQKFLHRANPLANPNFWVSYDTIPPKYIQKVEIFDAQSIRTWKNGIGPRPRPLTVLSESVFYISLTFEDEQRALAEVGSTPLHAAADRHVKSLAVAVRYAFAVARKQVNGMRALGGPGSGNFGHEGRPGLVGGSGDGDGGGVLTQSSFTGPETNTTGLVRDAAVTRLSARVKIAPDDLKALIDAEKENDLTLQEWVIGKSHDELIEGYIHGLLTTWSGGSGGPAVEQMARAVVAERLGGQPYSEQPGNEGSLAFMRENPGVRRALDAIGLAMYDDTQEWLKERGVTEVPLLRSGVPGHDRLHTSWSLHHGGVRYETGRPLVSETVLAKYIWSVPTTGFGTLAESEVVVLPRPKTTRRALSSEPNIDPILSTLSRELTKVLPGALTRCAVEGARVGIDNLSSLRSASGFRAAKKSVQFNAINKRAAAWAKKHAAEMVTDITETSRKRIKAAIASLLEGESYRSILDKIAKAVGDDDRAMLIARHETMSAVSAGQREAWNQAVEDDLLDDGTRRVWIATPIGACPICEKLDGKTAKLGGTYPGGSLGPPEHVACRCTEGLQAGRALGGPGSGNFGHEGRPGLVGGSGEGNGSHTETIKKDPYAKVPDVFYRGTKGGRFEDSPDANGGELGGGIYVTADKEVADGYSEGPGHVTHILEWVKKPAPAEIGYVEGVDGDPDDQRLIDGNGHEVWRERMTNDNVTQTRTNLKNAALKHGIKLLVGLDSSQGAGQMSILDRSIVRVRNQ